MTVSLPAHLHGRWQEAHDALHFFPKGGEESGHQHALLHGLLEDGVVVAAVVAVVGDEDDGLGGRNQDREWGVGGGRGEGRGESFSDTVQSSKLPGLRNLKASEEPQGSRLWVQLNETVHCRGRDGRMRRAGWGGWGRWGNFPGRSAGVGAPCTYRHHFGAVVAGDGLELGAPRHQDVGDPAGHGDDLRGAMQGA